MLRKSIAFLGTLIALFLMVGLQARSSAQTASAFTSNWGSSGTSILEVSVRVSYDQNGNLAGKFVFSANTSASGSAFTAVLGTATSMTTSEDTDGNYTSILVGTVYFETVSLNAFGRFVYGKAIAATATLTLNQSATGTSSESLTITSNKDSSTLFSTGSTAWNLSKGSIFITL